MAWYGMATRARRTTALSCWLVRVQFCCCYLVYLVRSDIHAAPRFLLLLVLHCFVHIAPSFLLCLLFLCFFLCAPQLHTVTPPLPSSRVYRCGALSNPDCRVLSQLARWLCFSNAVSVLLAAVCVVAGAFSLSRATVLGLQWCAITAVCLGSLLLLLALLGTAGARLRNRYSLFGFAALEGIVACGLLLSGAWCLALAGGSTTLSDLTWEAMSKEVRRSRAVEGEGDVRDCGHSQAALREKAYYWTCASLIDLYARIFYGATFMFVFGFVFVFFFRNFPRHCSTRKRQTTRIRPENQRLYFQLRCKFGIKSCGPPAKPTAYSTVAASRVESFEKNQGICIYGSWLRDLLKTKFS